MKKLIILLFLFTYLINIFGQEVNGITLGKTKSETQTKLLKHNFKLIKSTKHSIDYVGNLFTGESVTIRIYTTPTSQKVWKISIIKHYHKWYDVKDSFDKYNEILSYKYGSPITVKSHFKTPYYDGDGFEMSAMSMKMGEIVNTYTDLDNNRIYLKIVGNNINRVEIWIEYENKEMLLVNKNETNKIIYKTY